MAGFTGNGKAEGREAQRLERVGVRAGCMSQDDSVIGVIGDAESQAASVCFDLLNRSLCQPSAPSFFET